MKKLTVFIFTLFSVSVLFAASLPSLDGRAVVAEEGTMPKGLFARTVGYLPGDSVTVTNPSTGVSADILVLGAIDPSEGVAILLTPESARALKIEPDSNVQVKLTKRSGSLDENASGSAVLSNDETAKENDGPGSSEDSVSAENLETYGNENQEILENPAEKISEDSVPDENPADEIPAEKPEEILGNSENPDAVENEAPETAENPAVSDSSEVPSAENPDAAVVPVEEIPYEEQKKADEEPLPAASENDENIETEIAAEPAETSQDDETMVLGEEPAEAEKTSENQSESQLQMVEVVPVEKTEEKPAENLPVHEEELPALSEEDEKSKVPLQPVVVVGTEAEKSSGNDSEIQESEVEPETIPEMEETVSSDKVEDDFVPAEEISEIPAQENDELENADEEAPETAEYNENPDEENSLEAAEEPYDETKPADVPEVAAEPEVVAPEVVAEEAPSVSEPENKTEESSADEESSSDEAFQPIVLVPTEPVPPVSETKVSESAVSETTVSETTVSETSVSEHNNEEKSQASVAVHADKDISAEPEKVEAAEKIAPETKAAVSNDWKNYVVPSHKNLVKEKYYIQIASLGKEENIKNLIEKYSSKYPMVLIESKSGKSYQVMVGPLGIDEYGSVLEKMKSYGYKDAFVKKIK